MSNKPTKEEISAEVKALKALEPIGPFKRKTAATIQIQIDAIEGCIDETSDEFTEELSEEDQMNAMDAINWKNGDSDMKPSIGWDGLVK